MPKVSVVIPTYRRMQNLEMILEAWLFQTPDVWLADSSGMFETRLPINHVQFAPDPGNASRHAVALLTDGDFIIKADDDIVPKPGLIKDFLNYANFDGILGLMGRRFLGDQYYGKTKVFRAREIKATERVGFVGITTFTPRKYLAFDLRGCESCIEDLFWQMKAFPKVPKYVIPTTKYIQLPESDDLGCLFKDKDARVKRERFYKKYYEANYK